MDVLWILNPNRELQVPDNHVIHPLEYGVSMLHIKLELDRGSSMYYLPHLRHWLQCIP